MVMAGRIRLSFQLRMLLMLLGMCWLMAGALMTFQYHMEKKYRAEVLNARLQMHNARIIDDISRGEDLGKVLRRIGAPMDDLRLTVIAPDGRVTYDSRRPLPATNHNGRPEVKAARLRGEGYAIERTSQTDSTNYFYSARLCADGTVVRSAVPYTHSLTEFLAADHTMLWIILGVTLAVSAVGLFMTRKMAVSIVRLNSFAESAERGEYIYDGYPFPHDELGNIAANIVKLYVQRDNQHRQTIRLEQEKARLKRRLINNINHELKTPVASILVSVDLLTDHPDLPQEKKDEILARISANARRLSSLLKDVSTITRLDNAADVIEKHPVDLTALVKEIADEERLRTDMSITVDMPQLTVSGDRSLLESIFRNLIDNAIAHSGGTAIEIKADADGNFTVADNGRGVAPQHLDHIFERFYRVDDGRARSSGGTGLGLAIVRNAVAVHGGNITVTSGRGLRFSFRLR